MVSVADALTRMLAQRAPGTLCPSEVARAVAGEDWRAVMGLVHDAVADAVRDGRVSLSWQGKPRVLGEGAYRIGIAQDGVDDQ